MLLLTYPLSDECYISDNRRIGGVRIMLREIWRPPRLQTEVDDEHEHRATWLELFYDVVYIATISQLGSALGEDISAGGFLRFVILFLPIWWSWSGITFYMNRFIVDDFWHRLLIFVQMLAIAVVAFSIAEAFGTLATQFVLAYILIRVVLVILYYRAGKSNPQAEGLTKRFARGYGVGAVIWAASLLVAQPLQIVFWIVGMLAELLVPFLPGIINRQNRFPTDPPHLAERYGLFTIIVLGEAFVKVIGESPGIIMEVPHIVFSILVLSVIYALWWLYFGDVSVASIKESVWAMYTWTYGHFPLAVGVSMVAVAAKKLFVEPLSAPFPNEERLLFGGGLVFFLCALALIDRMTERDDESLASHWRAGIRLGAAAIIGAITVLGNGMSLLLFIVLITLVFVVQVGIDIVAAHQLAEQGDEGDETEDNAQKTTRAG
jgi:low temperature requirement protein LtrA